MSSCYSNTSLGELSPNDISGDNSFDVNYLPSSYGGSIDSGYYADSEFIPASSELSPELGQDVYSDSHLGYDGPQVFPIYYPIPTYYQVYYGVSSVENHGTTFYHYYPFAVPIYCLSSELTTENISSSDVGGVSDPEDFTNEIFESFNEASLSPELTTENITSSDLSSVSDPEDFTNEIFENVMENSYSDQFTPSSNNGNDIACSDPPEELTDEFTEYYDEAQDSSTVIPENDFTAEERKNDIKRKKDWLYLLSLSGKLSLKDHIPTVDVMPVLFEDDETTEISENNIESDESLHTVSCNDISPQNDTDHGDHKKKYPNNAVLETSDVMSTSNEPPPEETFPDSGEDKDTWNDFFFRSMEDEEFGIESCFNNSTFENDFVRKSSNNDGYKKKSNLSSTSGRTFMILGHLNKQIEILPTIEEEVEPVVESEKIEKPPLQISKENTMAIEEGCLRSKQQDAEEMEKSCGLAEATQEVGDSQKPKKKKFKRIRRFFSNITSCFSKIKEAPG